MPQYLAFGLNIDSELELPELSCSNASVPDVVIRLGHVKAFQSNIGNRNHRADADKICFYYPDVGRFRVTGNEIVVDLEPDAYDNLLRVCLLGPVLAALLHQRGLLVLHGSAINLGGSAVAFLGDKGWGKSTLAAFLQARGHNFLSDDVLALDTKSEDNIHLVPAFPQLKLWPDTAAYLRMDSEKMVTLQPDIDKQGHRLDQGFSQEALSLRAIYVLDIGDSEEIVKIEGRNALVELIRHSYLARYLQQTSTSTSHLRQCRDAVSSVPVYYLRRRLSLLRLPIIAELLEEAAFQPV